MGMDLTAAVGGMGIWVWGWGGMGGRGIMGMVGGWIYLMGFSLGGRGGFRVCLGGNVDIEGRKEGRMGVGVAVG
jgi:hypothetical protein